MLFREDGVGRSWIPGFLRRGERRRPKNRKANSRRARIETLESRDLLTTNIYVDFGDRWGQTGTGSGSARFTVLDIGDLGATVDAAGIMQGTLPPGIGEGAGLPYAAGQVIGFTPFNALVNAKGIQYDLGPQPSNNPFVHEDGPIGVPGAAAQLRGTILNVLTRMYAPFDIIITPTASRGWGDVRRTLWNNNFDTNPATPEPENGPLWDGFGQNDGYLFIGGFTANGQQIGDANSSFGFTSFTDTFFFGANFTEDTGIISADRLIDLAIAGSFNAGVAIGSVAGQVAGINFGLTHTQNGLPSSPNPFFDADLELFTGSDVMREGRSDGVEIYPTLTNTPFFFRWNVMEGGLNQDFSVTQNAYEQLANDFDIGASNFVAYVSGSGAFDRIKITRINNQFAQVTVDAYRTDTFLARNLIASTSYVIDYSVGTILVEGGRNIDSIEIDASIFAQVTVFGGHAVDKLIVVGDSSFDVTVTPHWRNDLQDDFSRGFVGVLNYSTGALLNFLEFDDESVVRLQEFRTMNYLVPGFLGANYSVRGRKDTMTIDGTVGPTDLTALAGVVNLEFTKIKNVRIDATKGAVNNFFSIMAAATIPTGLETFQINFGPGSGDRLRINDSAGARLVDYVINSNSVKYDGNYLNTYGLQNFQGYTFTNLDSLIVDGTKRTNTFTVFPSLDTRYLINGGGTTTPQKGDFVDMQFAGIPRRNLYFDRNGDGTWTFGSGYQKVVFRNIDRYFSSTLVVSGSSDAGTPSRPVVKVYDANTKSILFEFLAYENSFRGGVRVATGDLTGDGVLDIVTAPGAGRAGEIKIFDGSTGALLGSFLPEGSAYRNGLHVALGDVNADGDLEIITSVSRGAPAVRVYEMLSGYRFRRMASFMAYPSNMMNGVVVAAGHISGIKREEIVTVGGVGAVPLVRTWIYNLNTKQFDLRTQFYAFDSSFRNGVSLAVGDFNGDGRDEIFAGAGPGGRSQVRILSNRGRLQKTITAYTGNNANAAVRVATVNPFGIDRVMLMVGQSTSAKSQEIRMIDPLTGHIVDRFIENDGDFAGGVNVA